MSLLFLSSRFLTCVPSFIIGKLFLEKTPLNLQSRQKYVVKEQFLLSNRPKTTNFFSPYLFGMSYG